MLLLLSFHILLPFHFMHYVIIIINFIISLIVDTSLFSLSSSFFITKIINIVIITIITISMFVLRYTLSTLLLSMSVLTQSLSSSLGYHMNVQLNFIIFLMLTNQFRSNEFFRKCVSSFTNYHRDKHIFRCYKCISLSKYILFASKREKKTQWVTFLSRIHLFANDFTMVYFPLCKNDCNIACLSSKPCELEFVVQ